MKSSKLLIFQHARKSENAQIAIFTHVILMREWSANATLRNGNRRRRSAKPARFYQVGDTASGTTVYGIGIYAGGEGTQVLDNTLADTLAGTAGSGYGIWIDSPNPFTGAVVEHNRVSAVGQPPYSVGIIVQTGAHNNLLVNNRISNSYIGIEMYTPSEYRDNLTINTVTPYNGGTAEGTNNQ